MSKHVNPGYNDKNLLDIWTYLLFVCESLLHQGDHNLYCEETLKKHFWKILSQINSMSVNIDDI